MKYLIILLLLISFPAYGQEGTPWNEFWDKPDYSDPCRTAENDILCRRGLGINKDKFDLDRVLARKWDWSKEDKILGSLIVADRFNMQGWTPKAAIQSSFGILACEYYVPQGDDKAGKYQNETTACLLAVNLLLQASKLQNHYFIGDGGFGDKEAHFFAGVIWEYGCTKYLTNSKWICPAIGVTAMYLEEKYLENEAHGTGEYYSGVAGMLTVELINRSF